MDHPELFVPDPALAEEWDNPEMTAFKWQEAEDRVAFAKSLEASQWLESLRNSEPVDVVIRLAPSGPKRFPFKVIKLPW